MLAEKYRGYNYARLVESSYMNKYKGYRVNVQIMKWSKEGVRFIVSMWKGLEDHQIDEIGILDNL